MVTFGEDEKALGGNAVLLASDRPIPEQAISEGEGTTGLEQARLEQFAADAEVLRDDFAPADQLLTTP